MLICNIDLLLLSYYSLPMALFSRRNRYNQIDDAKGTERHVYVLIAIFYFTKWVEAASFAMISSKHVPKFLINNIICRYSVPLELISDLGNHSTTKVATYLRNIKFSITSHPFTDPKQMEQ